jgi:hypothetical protein
MRVQVVKCVLEGNCPSSLAPIEREHILCNFGEEKKRYKKIEKVMHIY